MDLPLTNQGGKYDAVFANGDEREEMNGAVAGHERGPRGKHRGDKSGDSQYGLCGETGLEFVRRVYDEELRREW